MDVLISDRQQARDIDGVWLGEMAARAMVLVGLSHESELSLSLVSDSEMAHLNETYRGKEGTTNVLAFPLFEGDEQDAAPWVLGDLVISTQTCLREAGEGGISFERRLLELLVHGLLHLSGRHHAGEKEMEEVESLTREVVDTLLLA